VACGIVLHRSDQRNFLSLLRVECRVMAIHLGPPLPMGSSDLPGSSGGPPSSAPLFGLAPGGVYLAPAVTGGTGELLPHRFTLTRHSTLRGYLWRAGFSQYLGNLVNHLDTPSELSAGRSVFCGTFLPVTGTGRYPAPCPAEPGLSSRHSTLRRDRKLRLSHLYRKIPRAEPIPP